MKPIRFSNKTTVVGSENLLSVRLSLQKNGSIEKIETVDINSYIKKQLRRPMKP